MLPKILIPVLSVAETALAAALFFTHFALSRLREQMADEIKNASASGPVKHLPGVHRQYAILHPRSPLNKCYASLRANLLLLALGIGAVAFCFGRLSGL
jgi:hypothetical protein